MKQISRFLLLIGSAIAVTATFAAEPYFYLFNTSPSEMQVNYIVCSKDEMANGTCIGKKQSSATIEPGGNQVISVPIDAKSNWQNIVIMSAKNDATPIDVIGSSQEIQFWQEAIYGDGLILSNYNTDRIFFQKVSQSVYKAN